MKTLRTITTRLGTVVALAMLAVVVPATRALASEPKGDLGVQLRLLEAVQGNGRGPSMTGVARIEVFVEAFRATNDIQLSVLRPDGSTWKVGGRPFGVGRPQWSDPGGEPLEPGDDGQSVPARGGIRTTIVVPLQGADIHEIMVVVRGLREGEEISTEGVVRVALGVPDNQPVDDGTQANFSLQGVN